MDTDPGDRLRRDARRGRDAPRGPRRGRPTARPCCCCTASPSSGTAGGTRSARWPRPASASWPPTSGGTTSARSPAGSTHYTLDALADDVVALIDATGRDRAAVVGHDWGGVVAWWVGRPPPRTGRAAGRAERPPPEFITRRDWTQPRASSCRSWYVPMFQLPWLPECGLGRLRGKALAESLRRDQPAGHVHRRGPRPLPRRLVAAGRPDRDDQLVPRRAARPAAPAPPARASGCRP